MKQAEYFILFFLILYATSCSDMSQDKSSVQGLNKKDIKPIKTLTIGEDKYVIGWQLESRDRVNYIATPKQLVKEESNVIEQSSPDLDTEESSVIEQSPPDLERDNLQVINNNSESNATQRKITGYQATRDPKTGKMIIYPVYEDE